MNNPTKYLLTILTIFCVMGLIDIGKSMATSPCVEIFSGAKIKLKSGDILDGYIIWSPYDANEWQKHIWDMYIKNAKKILFTKNVYVTTMYESNCGFYTAEESKEIDAKNIASIDYIKLEHNNSFSLSRGSIPLVMAKYLKSNKLVATLCKEDVHSYGQEKCIISFNKKYTDAIIEERFDELVKLPIKTLNKNKLIVYDSCND